MYGEDKFSAHAHGGQLGTAITQFGGNHWLDLSTGISPFAYPVPSLPNGLWHRLPEEDLALLRAAQTYYATSSLLAVAGSQAALRALPRLFAPCRVGVVEPCYHEHAHAWERAGHTVQRLGVAQTTEQLAHCQILIVVNPNNPTGTQLPVQTLWTWQRSLAARGGYLIVDEAFAEVMPRTNSMVMADPPAGLIVLRSMGKFFGLAGLRLGFVIAPRALCQALADELGCWTINPAAAWIGKTALTDTVWQHQQRAKLQQAGLRLRRLIEQFGHVSSGCVLFQSWPMAQAIDFWQHCAQQQILVRLFSTPYPRIRLGLPGCEEEWTRLTQVLRTW